MTPTDRDPQPFDSQALRAEARDRIRRRRPELSEMNAGDIDALVHELELHQVELEVQNEELRRSQLELNEARDRYRELYEYAPVGYLTLEEGGVVRRVNFAATQLCGSTRSEMLGKRIEELLVLEDRDACYLHLRAARSVAAGASCRVRLRRLDGTIVWVQMETVASEGATGDEAACGYRMTLTDVTAQTLSERAQLRSQEQLALALAAGNLGVCDRDMEAGETTWNPTLYALLGRAPGEPVHGDTFLSYVHESDRADVRTNEEEWLRDGGDCHFECRVVRQDGAIRWLAALGRAEVDGAGRVIRAARVHQDITDRKRAQEALVEARDLLETRVLERTLDLREALTGLEQRRRQIRELALELNDAEERERQRIAQILHDELQQMLVGIRFHIDAVAAKFGEPGELRSISELLRGAIEASRGLAHDLSPPAIVLERLALAVRWLGRQVKRDHGLTLVVTTDNPTEPQSMRVRHIVFRAIKELVFNAVKHAGVDTVSVRLYTLPSGELGVEVTDRGVGFAARSPSASAGMGMQNVGERLRLIGGRFELESHPGRGTTARIIAPTDVRAERRHTDRRASDRDGT